MPAEHVTLDELTDDLHEITHRIVWSVVSTSSAAGRPRSRVVHPVWWISPTGVNGLLLSRPTPVKVAHLAANPYLSCAYWSPDHDVAHLDCHAEWVPDEADRKAAWDAVAAYPAPMGYDPAMVWPGGPGSADFGVLRLEPYRIQVGRAAAMARKEPNRMWSA